MYVYIYIYIPRYTHNFYKPQILRAFSDPVLAEPKNPAGLVTQDKDAASDDDHLDRTIRKGLIGQTMVNK